MPVDYLLNEFVLEAGALAWLDPGFAEVDLSFLSFILFIAIIASMVQLVEMVVEKFSPALYASLGIFLPLIAVNCAILGGSLFMQERDYQNIAEATSFGLGLAVTFVLGITVPVDYLLNEFVLEAGALAWLDPGFAEVDLSFLSFILFIAIIASMVQLVEMVV